MFCSKTALEHIKITAAINSISGISFFKYFRTQGDGSVVFYITAYIVADSQGVQEHDDMAVTPPPVTSSLSLRALY